MAVTKLLISGYKELDDIKYQGKATIGSYALQLNPTELNYTFQKNTGGGNKGGSCTDDTNPRNEGLGMRSCTFSFMIDNTGAVPQKIDIEKGDLEVGSSITPSINKLKNIAIDVQNETHQAPFVTFFWWNVSSGGGAVSAGKDDGFFIGQVKSFSVKYTFFNLEGEPLRAEITLQIDEYEDKKETTREQQSPDITKIDTIKAGDKLTLLSEKYYDDQKYYMHLAKYNNLVSFRRLNVGKQLEFPPIKN